MSEGTGNAPPREASQSAHRAPLTEPPRRTARWLAPAGLAVTSGGTLAAGLQGNVAVAALSAAPSLLLGSFFFFGVVCPAIWSRKLRRQRAALAVMAALLGAESRRNTTRRGGPPG